jgi:predicted transcriptional regulator
MLWYQLPHLTKARYAHNVFLIMATMTIRTTVAFNPASAARLERLAMRWGVSKSETLRRALEKAEQEAPDEGIQPPDFSGMAPLEILDWLARNPSPGIPGGWGDDPHQELREMRELDAKIEEERGLERSGIKFAQCEGQEEP